MPDKRLTVQERSALLQSLMSQPSKLDLPTKDARQALKIIKSLQKYQPVTLPTGSKSLVNPVTNVQAHMVPGPKGNEISFTTNNSLQRPSVPNSRIQALGVRATVNQIADQIPITRNKLVDPQIDNRYTFTPIQDEKDIMREYDTGRPSNQRAKAYQRNTKGAFQAHQNKDGTYVGYGTRKADTTWQPRAAGGKFGKFVKFDPADAVRELSKIGVKKAAVRFIPGIGKYLQGMMTFDDLIRGATGKGSIEFFVEEANARIKDKTIPRPATLMIR